MKTNSKDTLCDAIRAIKAQLVKTPEDEARFRAEANFFVRQALENTGFVRTKLSHCVDLFKSVFSSGLSWDPRAHHVSLILAEDVLDLKTEVRFRLASRHILHHPRYLVHYISFGTHLGDAVENHPVPVLCKPRVHPRRACFVWEVAH